MRYLLTLPPHFLILSQQLPDLHFLRTIREYEAGLTLNAGDLSMQLLVLTDELSLTLEQVGIFILEVDLFLDLLVGLRV